MLISCEVCILELNSLDENDEAKSELAAEISEKCFAAGADLREHLVEFHAKYVARALLEPDLNDATHFWLLANVDYSAATIADDLRSNYAAQNRGTTKSANNLSDLRRGLSSSKFLQSLLASTLNANRAFGMNFDDQRRSPTLHDLFNFNPLNSIFGDKFINGGNEMQMAKTFDEEDSSENTDFFQQQAAGALVESKAIRKTECQICKINICSTARQRHVYMIHLRQKDLFQCSVCDYTNSNSIWELRKHCASQHLNSDDARAISNEEKHKHSIQMWNQRCFPDWKQKKLTSWFRGDSPTSRYSNSSSDCFVPFDNFVPGNDLDECSEEQSHEIQERRNGYCDNQHEPRRMKSLGACLEDFLQKIRRLNHMTTDHVPMENRGKDGDYDESKKNNDDVSSTEILDNNDNNHFKRKLDQQQNGHVPTKICINNKYEKLPSRITLESSTNDVGATSEETNTNATPTFSPTSPSAENIQKVGTPSTSLFQIDWSQLAALANSEVAASTSCAKSDVSKSVTSRRPSATQSAALTNGERVPTRNTYRMTQAVAPPSGTQLSANDRICHVCWEESRYPGRHIAQKHLSHHLYECPFGDGFGSYESCAVVKHIRKCHGPSPAITTPMNNVERLADEIMDLQRRCFPNRPMKLLRGYMNSKLESAIAKTSDLR